MAKNTHLVAVAIAALFVVGGFAGYVIWDNNQDTDQQLSIITQSGERLANQAGSTSCPDSGTTSLSLTVYNALNTSGTESYDNTAYIYSVNDGEESLFATLTDTTSGTDDLNCGDVYRIRIVSTDGEGGDSSLLMGVRAGKDADVGGNGEYVEFTAQGAQYNLELESKQHTTMLFKLFDNKQNGWVYDSNDASATDYESTGVTFKSTTDNSTAMSVGSGESLDLRYTLKGNSADGDFADHAMYILVDAASGTWQEPDVRFEGVSLSNMKGQLDSSESVAYSDYEYVYVVEVSDIESALIPNKDKFLDFDISARDNVDPDASDDISVDFASVGAVKETSGNMVHYGATDDSSSPSSIYTLQETTIDVS